MDSAEMDSAEMDSAEMLKMFRDIRQAQKDEDGLLGDLLSIFERMKSLNLSRDTGENVHGYSQDEDGLLDGGISILEQMKALNGSRGTNMEMLAQAHVAEVDRLNDKYATDMKSKLQHTKDLEKKNLHHKEEIHQLKTREISTADSAQGRVLAAYFEVEIGKIKLEFDKAIARHVDMFRKLELIRWSREDIVRRTRKYAERTNYVYNQLHNSGLHFYVPRHLELASTGFTSLIDDSKSLQEDMQHEIDRRVGWKEAMRAYAKRKEKENKAACYRRLKKLVDLVIKSGLEMKPYFMDELFEYGSSKAGDD